MCSVFGLLGADDEAKHLGKARLVCSGWARGVMCMNEDLARAFSAKVQVGG